MLWLYIAAVWVVVPVALLGTIWLLGRLAALGGRRHIRTGRVRTFTIEQLRLRAAERDAITQHCDDAVADPAPRPAERRGRFVRDASAASDYRVEEEPVGTPSASRGASVAVAALVAAGALLGAPVDAGAGAPCRNADMLPTEETLEEAASATLCLINRERAERGRAPLHENSQLAWTASRYSREMVSRGFFAHTTPEGETFVDRVLASHYVTRDEGWALGETLAWGTGRYGTPTQIVVAWMHSPHHRAAMLERRFRRVGVGIATSVPVRRYADLAGASYTALFGSPNRHGPSPHARMSSRARKARSLARTHPG
jgi:uncharacterized protein YkwD